MFNIAFVGTNYHGFQIQQNANTVQNEFQNAIEKIFNKRFDIKGCSRTDSGVHANCYYINSIIEQDISPQKLTNALNFHLPTDIRVCKTTIVSDDFHARYYAKSKRYVYKIWNKREMNPFLEGRALHFIPKIEQAKIDEISKVFLGTHDFLAFCSNKNEQPDTVRTIYDISVKRDGEIVTVSVQADGFLYNMVRIIVGSLLSASRGKLDKQDIENIIKSKKRNVACITAPAHGLYLDRVYYEKDDKQI